MTLREVAAAANCSVSLASIVMRGAPGASQETRARVQAVAKRLGYRPDQRARALRATSSGLIGVTFGIHQPFHADLVEGLYAAASTDHELVLSAVVSGVDDIQAAESLMRDRCEALVMLGPSVSVSRMRALGAEIPLVVVARPVAAQGFDVVRIDEQGGIELAVAHLADLGHTRIVHVDGGRAPASAERRSGYLAAMDRRGLGRHAAVVAGGLEEENGRRACAELVAGEQGLPTGVVVFNDRCAAGLVQGLIMAGVRVPQDVSVVGFDNSHRARTCVVPLTTVAQDPALMARLAVERALGLAAGRFLPTEMVLVPDLVERSSTALPRA